MADTGKMNKTGPEKQKKTNSPMQKCFSHKIFLKTARIGSHKK